MLRACLGCGRPIATGSRCNDCNSGYRSAFSRHEWARAVKERDGYRCVRCGSQAQVEAHHIVPLERGGQDTLANGETLCHECHRGGTRAQPTGFGVARRR